MKPDHQKYLQVAITEAKKAGAKKEVPIGAVIIDAGGNIIGRGRNQTHTNKDGLGHAELVALRQAQRKLGDWRFPGAKMYVTLEPCLMCLGAIGNARIKEVYYGLADPLFGSIESKLTNKQVKKMFPKLECYKIPDDGTVAGLMKQFFQDLRKR